MQDDNSSSALPGTVPATLPTISGAQAQVIEVLRPIYDLFKRNERRETWYEEITKTPKPEDREEQSSEQGIILGEKFPPFNMNAAIAFKNQNPHHSTCIETKARATVGLGFKSSKKKPQPDPLTGAMPEEEEDTFLADQLDPLCDTTFQDLMNSVVEDYWQVGNAYIEVVRAKGRSRKIVGLHYVPAGTVRVCLSSNDYDMAYLVQGELGMDPKILAPFGELDYMLKNLKRGKKVDTQTSRIQLYAGGWGTPSERSEIIHFKRCTSMSRWYGFPDWLSAIANIELVQMMIQEKFDFFLNRGVPEFMLFLLGKKIDPETWKKINMAIQATVGQGNQHKTIAVNIDDTEMQVQLERLAMESGSANQVDFSKMAESLALDIVSAHRTPPILAGIQISGKMGATNELPNALLAFQVLVIGPEQNTISSTLSNTLGNQKRNGGLATRAKHFKLKTILEQIPTGAGQQQPGATPTGQGMGANGLKALDTQSRMRTPAASANGRDLTAGVKKDDA